MIFKDPQQILDGRKRQTRRPVKPDDIEEFDEFGDVIRVWRGGRILWEVGKDYAVQPGRGKKALGRTPPLKEIRRGRVRDISVADCRAEGIPSDRILARFAFEKVWNSIYRKPYRWVDDPEVWVLEFERVKDAVYE